MWTKYLRRRDVYDLGGPPRIAELAATDVYDGEATLHATIYPENEPNTSYRFEYGTTTAYGTSVPVGEGHISGSTPMQVSQPITGLLPDTTYHFRVVASNGVGSPITTTDTTFTTYANPGEAPSRLSQRTGSQGKRHKPRNGRAVLDAAARMPRV